MNKQNVTNFFKSIGNKVSKHSPEILTAIGIAGMVTTTVMAVKATPKALELIEEKKKELELKPDEELTAIETVQAAWKPYVPAVATGIFSTACLIGSHSIHAKRNMALASAYKISTTALNEYREKVVETIGENKEKKVRDAVAKKKVEEKPVTKSEVYITGGGSSLIFDPISGRYFESTIDKIKRAELELNSRMVDGMEMYMSLNEFYDEIGLPHTQMGDQLGWRADNRLDIAFSSQIADNEKPCLVVDYINPPVYGYNSIY